MKKDFFEPGHIYHIFNRGNNKENIFREEQNYYHFLNLMKKYLLPISDIYAYCLLKNHFHLVIRIKDKELLPEKFQQKPYLAFSNMFNSYSKAFNKMYNRTGSLFQEHLPRIRVESEEYLLQLIAYIHLNPVKHKFTDDFKSYPFSSYLAYTTSKPTNVETKFVMEIFGDISNFEYWHDENRITMEERFLDI